MTVEPAFADVPVGLPAHALLVGAVAHRGDDRLVPPPRRVTGRAGRGVTGWRVAALLVVPLLLLALSGGDPFSAAGFPEPFMPPADSWPGASARVWHPGPVVSLYG